MSAVREELGPSLPQLLAPYWRPLSRRRRILVIAAAVGVLVLLIVARFVLRADPLKVVVIREPVAFNLIHRADFGPAPLRPGELLRLDGVLPGGSGAHDSFVVRRLTVPAYRGDVSSAYLLLATRRLEELQAADPQLRYRGEGKARINLIPGYQLSFQTRSAAGKLVFGKLFFLVPEAADPADQTRDGVELELLADRSGQTPNEAAVGGDVLLKAPLRSFRFGTERP